MMICAGPANVPTAAVQHLHGTAVHYSKNNRKNNRTVLPGHLSGFESSVRWPKANVRTPATMVGGPRRRRFFPRLGP